MNVKVLLLDCTLHKKDATGITLSNLFGNMPKDCLFMIGDSDRIALSTEEGYKKTFTLGNDELKHVFPLGFFKRILFFLKYNNLKIRHIHPDSSQKHEVVPKMNTEKQKKGVRRIIFRLVDQLFLYFGLNHLLFRCQISKRLDKWITEAKPDFFYALLSTRHSILFATEITKKYNKPLIIHIMDDWPTTIGNETLTPKFWNRKINSEFRNLLQLTEKRIAISRLMAEEYQKRFGGAWLYFHNPVDTTFWSRGIRKPHKNKSKFTILYSGRISSGITGTLKLVGECVDELSIQEGLELSLIIQSNLKPDWIANFTNTTFNLYVPYDDLPELFASVDLLLLPYEFYGDGFNFIRLSMPTKVSEYMASGTPIVIVAPEGTALVDYATKYSWGFIITDNSKKSIKNGIRELVSDQFLRQNLGVTGIKLAKEFHEISIVQQHFKSYFTK
jgi:glycosyltransferase involved in cell wall biosynthesis